MNHIVCLKYALTPPFVNSKSTSQIMKLENIIRALAGTLILTGLILTQFVNPNWVWLSAFVGFNLLQSAFTGFCPAEIVLKKFGLCGS